LLKLEDEIMKKYKEAYSSYKRTKFQNFEIDLFIKFANSMVIIENKVFFNEATKIFLDSLLNLNTEEVCKYYCKISTTYKRLNMLRKSSYYIRLVIINVSKLSYFSSF